MDCLWFREIVSQPGTVLRGLEIPVCAGKVCNGSTVFEEERGRLTTGSPREDSYPCIGKKLEGVLSVAMRWAPECAMSEP